MKCIFLFVLICLTVQFSYSWKVSEKCLKKGDNTDKTIDIADSAAEIENLCELSQREVQRENKCNEYCKTSCDANHGVCGSTDFGPDQEPQHCYCYAESDF
uniref:CF salivary antigen 1-like protein n=1 Tax=Xenopsylla cheopis TaxID=163159 RepID=A2IAB7_XENCH|nr:CF salivary antigen 1 precursor-like protein [Xenopsylla cheopis]